MGLSFEILGRRHLQWLTNLRNQNREWFFDDTEATLLSTETWFLQSCNRGDLNLVIRDPDSDDMVGFISLYAMTPGGCASIGHMMVDDKFKHQGYMEKAMCKVFDLARSYFRLCYLVLEVKKENIPARQLYSKLGFVTYGFTTDRLIQRKML